MDVSSAAVSIAVERKQAMDLIALLQRLDPMIKEQNKWKLIDKAISTPVAYVSIPIVFSWVLFSKSIRPHEIMDQVVFDGDKELATKVLEMVSVMA